MANELAVIERQLFTLEPQFNQLLAPMGLSGARIIRSVVISCDRNARLLECTPNSIMQSATTGAVLGLEADGVSGQGFLVPFADRKNNRVLAQWLTGYKGQSTLGWRSGLTIAGEVVREGDEFDYEEGSGAFVRFKRRLGGEKDRRIIAAWATATAVGHAPIVCVMSIDEILEVKSRAPGGAKPDSPWSQGGIPYAAMCAKTARRRMARSLPLSPFVLAARIDEAHEEQGAHAYLDPERGIVIDGGAVPFPESSTGPTPSMVEPPKFIVQGRDTQRIFPSIEQWRAEIMGVIRDLPMSRRVQFYELNKPWFDRYRGDHPQHVQAVEAALAIPERAEVVDPRPKPPEEPDGESTYDGAGSRSETEARPSGGGVTPAPSLWDREDLTIPCPYRGTRPDWPAWSAEFFKIASTARNSTDLAMLIGSNEKNIAEDKRVAGDLEASRFDNAKDVIFKRLPA